MIRRRNPLWFVFISLGILSMGFLPQGQVTLLDGFSVDRGGENVRVEIFLSQNQKKREEAIREHFKSQSVENVHFQYFRAGRPPENLAVGRRVPARIAQLAIQVGIDYNRDVRFLLLQELLPPNWLGIGTSAFDELSQIPISSQNLQDLMDSSLTNEEFHSLYRKLAVRKK